MYPQSNGSSERIIQTVEYTLKKCEEDGSDPYLGLLSYRTTPISPHLESLVRVTKQPQIQDYPANGNAVSSK